MDIETALAGAIILPDRARADLRHHLGLRDSENLRVTYIAGTGDVAGTFDHWRAGRHEPRVPIIAYSLMFYELMDRLGADCQIIAIHPIDTSAPSTGDRFRFEQARVLPWRGRWSWLRSQRKYARDLVSMARAFDPHIVITSTHDPAASWKGLANGRKLILTAHNSFWPMGRPPQDIKGRLRKALLSWRARALDAAICTSHECARQITDVTGGRIHGEVQCPQALVRYPIEQRTRVRKLLFLGRIEHSKGVFFLLDVFEQLASRHPELTLDYAGSGSAQEALKNRLAVSPHTGRIKFLGRVDSEGVHSAIAAADLLVCPTMTSFNEGLAVVGFEGAAHGIPTVLSSVVPAADLLKESSTVYAADNSTALCEALSGLIEDPETYRDRCAATAAVRDRIYDRSQSWGSGLFRTLMTA
jgi:glycogen synthase